MQNPPYLPHSLLSPPLPYLHHRQNLISTATAPQNSHYYTTKDVPKELLSKKIDKGQMMAYQRGKVCVMKWMDKKAVCLISTIHNPEMVQVQSHKNEIRRKPKAVMEYNNTMGGVDRLDKHLTNYPLIKKRGRMDIVDCLIERYGEVSGKKGRPGT
ncbi:piggyBac transposable element-derived protein 4 [Trichonephila clavipes]|nr:piggyBac transposable element-derived protein 4 [Trichonephila clavipes]